MMSAKVRHVVTGLCAVTATLLLSAAPVQAQCRGGISGGRQMQPRPQMAPMRMVPQTQTLQGQSGFGVMANLQRQQCCGNRMAALQLQQQNALLAAALQQQQQNALLAAALEQQQQNALLAAALQQQQLQQQAAQIRAQQLLQRR